MMALRLKKDVQKASYYVWFLGAQEAKELRGERVLLSTIPRLIERAGHLEPLKVTLQISHKGLKIIQVCNKPFTAVCGAVPITFDFCLQFSLFRRDFFSLKTLNIHARYDFNTEKSNNFHANYGSKFFGQYSLVHEILLSKSHLFAVLMAIVSFSRKKG